MTKKTICGLDFDQFIFDMEDFHGARAPGIVVGALMLDTALARVPDTPDLVVAVETMTCLPDAVQVLTSCTIGNGRLKVYDWGKYALSAYNRQMLKGVRTWVVAETVAKWPSIDAWFNPSRRAGDRPPFDELADAFFRARSELIEVRDVRIVAEAAALPKKQTAICKNCGESYSLHCGALCSACQGLAYYR
jgi:formylmethanofuran dehydrogenase subunit E